jgi:hypothetical protein
MDSCSADEANAVLATDQIQIGVIHLGEREDPDAVVESGASDLMYVMPPSKPFQKSPKRSELFRDRDVELFVAEARR